MPAARKPHGKEVRTVPRFGNLIDGSIMQRFPLPLAAAAAALIVSGCSLWPGGDDPTPQTPEERIEALKLPPNLERERTDDALVVPESGATATRGDGEPPVLPNAPRITVRRAGGDRWLTVAAPPERVFNLIRDYFGEEGVDLARIRPELGILETGWLFTNRPLSRGALAPTLPGPAGATAADRYLVRIEAGDGGNATDVFVAHRRVLRPEGEGESAWRLGDSDPFLEAEVVRSLMVHLGVSLEDSFALVAAAPERQDLATLERMDGRVTLRVAGPAAEAWERVGLALDRAAFTVVERNREAGNFVIRYDTEAGREREDGGFLSTLAFWRDSVPRTVVRYTLEVANDDGGSRVRVLTDSGDAAPEAEAEEILGLLEEQLR